MYYKLKSNIMFRDYDSFGYISDNRNYGYKQANDEGIDVGDKIVSQSGAVFLSVLKKIPQTLDTLVDEIKMRFEDVDIKTIENDAKEFYDLLESDGFIVSSETSEGCNKKDVCFSYKNVIPLKKNIDCSKDNFFKESTQNFFDEYYKNKSHLTNLHIEITSECNERCLHCYIPHEYKINSMNPNLFYSILYQSKKMNLLHLTITGGEPMLHNNFIDFLRKCNEHNFSINILSNLTLLNQDILAEMRKNSLLSVQTSLYSMNPNIHDSITQVKGSFEKTKNAILTLIENDIPLQISCPILKQNMNCYYDVIAWGKEHNINVGSDYALIARYNHTTQNLSNRLSENEVKDIIEKMIVNDPTHIERIELEIQMKKNIHPDDYICSVCHSSVCISEDGNVYPCAGWQDYVVGNMNTESLFNIWNESIKIKYLRNLRRRDFKKCIECSENQFCNMCMVRNANESVFGNPLEVNDFFCSIAKLNKQIFLEKKLNNTKS